MTKRLTTERDGSPSSSRTVAVWSAVVVAVVLPIVACFIALRDGEHAGGIITALGVLSAPLAGLSVGALFSKRKPKEEKVEE